MMEASGQTRVAHRPGALLFLFSTFEDLRASDPLALGWIDAGQKRGSVDLSLAP